MHVEAPTSSGRTPEWDGYYIEDFTFADYPPGSRVLDVGFGAGEQMRALREIGCLPVGVEYDRHRAARARAQGLPVCRAEAERLPFAAGSFDGVICKVVIPYTDEAAALAEIGLVLRRGAIARLSYHGLGYYLRYLFLERNWKRRVYAARVLVNTLLYRASGRRLPGFWGDTVYQSAGRLTRYYERLGLELIEARTSRRFAGAPVFLCHALRKT